MENEVVEKVDIPTTEIDLAPITEGNEKITEKLDEMIELLTPDDTEVIEPTEALDYTDQLNNIADLLQQQNDMLTTMHDANNTILVYGLIIAPLFLLCMCLWWFFKQFLYRF